MNITKLPDEKTKQMAEQSTALNKKESSTFSRKFAHFLLEFEILTTGISLLIALQFQVFMKELMDLFFSFFHSPPVVIQSFVTMIITLLMCFLFIHFVFYRYIYTEEVAKEIVMTKAIQKKTEDVAVRKIEADPSTTQGIQEKTSMRKNAEPFFSLYYS